MRQVETTIVELRAMTTLEMPSLGGRSRNVVAYGSVDQITIW